MYFQPYLQHSSITVLECDAIPMWLNVIPDTVERRFMTTIEYTCAEGYHFTHSTENTTLVSTCNAKAHWEPPIANCSGKL